MHIDGFSHGLDEEARLTADEASQLAQYLPTAADRIEGNRSGQPCVQPTESARPSFQGRAGSVADH